jgi:hypothetical protein
MTIAAEKRGQPRRLGSGGELSTVSKVTPWLVLPAQE